MNRDDSDLLGARSTGVLAGAALWLATTVPGAAAGPVDVPLRPELWEATPAHARAGFPMPEIAIDVAAIASGRVLSRAGGPAPSPVVEGAEDHGKMISDSTRARPASDSS